MNSKKVKIFNIFSPMEAVVLSSLLFFLIGVMTALTAKYPVGPRLVLEAQALCEPDEPAAIKVKLTGELSSVTCSDGRKIDVTLP